MSLIALVSHGIGNNNAGAKLPIIMATAFTANNKTIYGLNTIAGAFTVMLPPTPTNGWWTDFFDYAGTFDTSSATINGNGKPILGLLDTYVLNQKNQGRRFIFLDNTRGWLVK